MQETRNKANVQITVGQVALLETAGGGTLRPAWGPRTWGRVLRLDRGEGTVAVGIEEGAGSELVVSADDVTATVDNSAGAALHSGSEPESELPAAVTVWLKEHQAELAQFLSPQQLEEMCGLPGVVHSRPHLQVARTDLLRPLSAGPHPPVGVAGAVAGAAALEKLPHRLPIRRPGLVVVAHLRRGPPGRPPRGVELG